MEKKRMSEEDVKLNFITPAILRGWNGHITMETKITDGRINIKGNMVARSKPKFADYLLYLNDGKPIAVVEAKDNNHSVSYGLQQAMTYAQMMDIPFAYSSKETFALTDKEMETLKVGALERYAKNNEYHNRNGLVLLLILNLGLRAGEALALTWDDIDFENEIVKISKTVEKGIKNEGAEGNAYISIITDTKTKAGTRVLKLNETTLEYLNELKEYDKRNGIRSKYVCCNKYGGIQTHENLQKTLNNISRRMELRPDITLHTLRHSFGSALIRRGEKLSVVSSLMGHANSIITAQKYIHTIQEEEAKAMTSTKIC